MKKTLYLNLILAFIFCMSQVHAQTNPCGVPTGLTSTNITSSSATVSWLTAGNAATYNVRYRVAGSVAWSTTSTSNPSANLTSLLSLTTYEWQVQRGCPGPNGGITLSAFSGSANFTTLGLNTGCPVPTGLYTNNITHTSAKLHWAATGATSYKIRYRATGSTTWTIKTSVNLHKDLTGLNPGTGYEWQVRSKCINSATGNITWSAWSPTSVFQTLSTTTCNAPTNLTNTSTTNAIVLTWSATGAISYNIRYRPSNTLGWTTTTSATNTKQLSGLPGSTTFEWQVQSVCGSNGVIVVSAWSAIASFSTSSPIVVSPNPARDNLSVSVEKQSSGQVQLTIRDLSGAIMVSQTVTGAAGENKFDIPVSDLKNGMYYLELSDLDGKQTVKFYVAH